jgi:hypothetical protein
MLASFLSQGRDMTLETIKEAIGELSAPEKTTLIRWLAEKDSDPWDRQMEADFSEGGAGMPLLAQWDSEIKTVKQRNAQCQEFRSRLDQGLASLGKGEGAEGESFMQALLDDLDRRDVSL